MYKILQESSTGIWYVALIGVDSYIVVDFGEFETREEAVSAAHRDSMERYGTSAHFVSGVSKSKSKSYYFEEVPCNDAGAEVRTVHLVEKVNGKIMSIWERDYPRTVNFDTACASMFWFIGVSNTSPLPDIDYDDDDQD